MNLIRKSSKATIKVSLIVSVIMLVALAVTIQAQGLPTGYLMDNGVPVCKAGLIELVSMLLW